MAVILPKVSSLYERSDRLDSAEINEAVKSVELAKNFIQSGRIFSSNNKDALALVDKLLTKHISDQEKKAQAEAEEIKKMAHAIADINRIWGLIMQDKLPQTNPNNNSTTTLGGTPTSDYLTEIDRIIRDELGNSEGIAALTGENLADSKSEDVSYSELQAMNATMTAYCDTIQVDINSQEQEFKNIMTMISSTQAQIREVQQAIVGFAKGLS